MFWIALVSLIALCKFFAGVFVLSRPNQRHGAKHGGILFAYASLQLQVIKKQKNIKKTLQKQRYTEDI